MERREPRARGGRRGACEAAGGSSSGAPEGGEAVVQRTQVVLLAGEPWGLDGGQTVLSSFAHHVVPSSSSSTAAAAAAAHAPPPPPSSSSPPGPPLPPAPASLPSSPSGRLIFFLCRASSLRDREARLREVLRGVQQQQQQQPPPSGGGGGGGGGGAPAVLVGVVVQPPPGEEEAALRSLQDLLRDAFPPATAPGPPAPPLELHTALFAPGRPQGALELRRLARKPSATSLSLDKALVMQVLGAVVSLGTLAYGGYYAYNHLLLE